MTDQERLDEIDRLDAECANLHAGLKANGDPEPELVLEDEPEPEE